MTHKESNDKPTQLKLTVVAGTVNQFAAVQTEPSYILGMLPVFGYVRLTQLVLDPKKPNRPAIVPISRATLWRWVKLGTFPTPIKLSNRVTAWRVDDVKKWLSDHGS